MQRALSRLWRTTTRGSTDAHRNVSLALLFPTGQPDVAPVSTGGSNRSPRPRSRDSNLPRGAPEDSRQDYSDVMEIGSVMAIGSSAYGSTSPGQQAMAADPKGSPGSATRDLNGIDGATIASGR